MSASIDVRPDGVGIITMNNAPVNSLSQSLVSSFKQEFPKLVNDPKVKAIVVTGANGFFCGGAEITEFALVVARGPEAFKDSPPTQSLCEMVDMIDHSPKTTVAAVNGQALGGGLEVALACHYRVASPKAAVGFPEVNLGILPGGQGTQRLPRVAPLQPAMQMILLGKPVPIKEAQKNGIVDVVAKGADVVAEAAAFSLGNPPNPISKRPVPFMNRLMAGMGALEQGELMAANQAPGMVAPAAIVNCLRAACSKMSFEEGLAVEAHEFTKLVFGVQSGALRHLFFAERLAQKVPGVDVPPAPLKKVGILGAGLMGGGIAMCFAEKGIPVVLKDAQQDWLDDGLKKVHALWQGQAQRGRITEEKFKQLTGLVRPTLRYEDFGDVDMVVEAVPEIMDLKKQVFLDMEKHMRPDALICTNTSGLNIDDIASVLKDPSRVMGCHFFSPANVMQLLENVRTAKASARTLATGMAMGKLIGKKAVMVGNCDGFVGNRMIAPYAAEAKMLFEEGADIELIDEAAVEFGMAMGPMSLGDLVGQELFWKQRKAAGDMKKQTKTYFGPYELTDWLCEQGRFGQKTPDPKIKATGRGIFIHRGRDKVVDPEVNAKMAEIRKMKGMPTRKIGKEEIIERLFFPLINEGFRILEEGYCARPSDVDMVYIFGYGFPPAKGGPMFYAEHYVGLPKLLERLKVYAEQAKQRYSSNPAYLPVDYFEPSKLLEACASRHGTKVQPGVSLVETVLRQLRSGDSGTGPFSKL
uniref:Peroxisomal bifunctional protein n=1 Tax=Gambierdiscus polynesiensis TaxID=439318 RepID=A0A6M5KF97_9DINO|nr:peroxisomal bifunctional protein [Gambierdiscus polynesiensis]